MAENTTVINNRQQDKRSSTEIRSDDENTPLGGETNGSDRLQAKSLSLLQAAEADMMPTVTVIPAKKNRVGTKDTMEPSIEEINDKADSTSTAKKTVFIRVVFMKLGEIDTVKETFSADVFIQARWREPRLDGKDNAAKWNGKPVSPDNYTDPKIVIDNAVGDPKESVSTVVDYPNKNSYDAYVVERRRIKGTFLENYELFQFPFDTQDLTVTLISELPDTEVVLEDDPHQLSTINTEMFVDEQEWRLYNEVQVLKDNVVKFYQLDTDDNRSHSVLSCRTHASRRPGFYIYSVFLIMCLICSMTFCTFSVDLNKRENRLQLTFILLLTTVTFKFAVNSSLPRISYLTTLDVYILSSSIILILVCIWHAIVIPIQYFQGTAIAAVADLAVLGVLGLIYFFGHVVIALWIGVRAIKRNRKYEDLEEKHMKRLKKQCKQQMQKKQSILRRVIIGLDGKAKAAAGV